MSAEKDTTISTLGTCENTSPLNLSTVVGDDIGAVQQNRRILLGHMKAACLAFSNQIHGTQVLTIDQRSFSGGVPEIFHAGTGDAMITNIPGVALVLPRSISSAI